MQDDRFEWDDEKARSNLAKHKVPFEVAKLVFGDPQLLDEVDDSMDYDEERYKAVGMIDGRVLSVVYTVRSERTRLISARKATAREEADHVRQRNLR